MLVHSVMAVADIETTRKGSGKIILAFTFMKTFENQEIIESLLHGII